MKVQVCVRLKPGVLDVQGKAVENGLIGLGFKEVSGVRVGRLIEFDVQGSNEQAREQVKIMCDKLLCNPIIENYEICGIA